MARRPTNPRELPDALRDAVDRTVQATLGSAERSRDRTQGALDDVAERANQLVRGAEAGIARSRRAVTGAIDERRPATQDDLREIKAELRAIGRRLIAIEDRLPAKRAHRGSTSSGSDDGPKGRSRSAPKGGASKMPKSGSRSTPKSGSAAPKGGSRSTSQSGSAAPKGGSRAARGGGKRGGGSRSTS